MEGLKRALMRPIVLTGFMGVGKSTTGRALAKALNIPFVDLDRKIEEETGRPIPELFQREGEARFREIERDCLRRTLQAGPMVLATGGGTLCSEDSLQQALSMASVIWLKADFEILWRRISRDSSRPLVALGEQEVRRRFREREAFYGRAHRMVDTTGRTPDRVAGMIRQLMEESLEPVDSDELLKRPSGHWEVGVLQVTLPSSPYPIVFHRGGLPGFAQVIRHHFPAIRRAGVVTNPTVGALYYEPLERGMKAAGIEPFRLDVPDGEHAKSLTEVERLTRILIEERFERREPLIALGGGVVGDLTGFVASIYLRGVPFVQVPTTLLAQVDSSVGGKTGVNSPLGKNLIGSFYQPSMVLMDVEVLRTLADDEYRSGLAEVVKYAAIRDSSLWAFLETHAESIRSRETRALEALVCRCCANKAQVVIRDEREEGERATLNFGHTLGHAIEAVAGYGEVKHGLAVGIGMAFATRLSVSLGFCPLETVDRLESMLETFSIPTRMPVRDVRACMEAIRRDKKVAAGALRFVLLDGIGRSRIERVPFESLQQELSRFVDLSAPSLESGNQ